MSRLRIVFLGGMLSGAVSMLLAPRLGGARRGPLARLKPLAVLDRRALAQFAGTPCSRESEEAESTSP
jgi:hypothetical protein